MIVPPDGGFPRHRGSCTAAHHSLRQELTRSTDPSHVNLGAATRPLAGVP